VEGSKIRNHTCVLGEWPGVFFFPRPKKTRQHK
jgi:hypothetical protein